MIHCSKFGNRCFYFRNRRHAGIVETRVVPDALVPAAQVRTDALSEIGHHGLRVVGECAGAGLNVVSGQGQSGLKNLRVDPGIQIAQLLLQEFARPGRGVLGEYLVALAVGFRLVRLHWVGIRLALHDQVLLGRRYKSVLAI